MFSFNHQKYALFISCASLAFIPLYLPKVKIVFGVIIILVFLFARYQLGFIPLIFLFGFKSCLPILNKKPQKKGCRLLIGVLNVYEKQIFFSATLQIY